MTHVAGNSSGGWIALELGRLHRARTVTGLSPAGLWRRTAPRHIRLAVTIAFGSRDRVLLPGVARRRDQLPDHTRWVTLAGCGHVPMFDDPQAVTDLLLAATHPDTAGELGKPIRGR